MIRFFCFQVLSLLRYPRYLLLCRNLFGNEGEILIEEIFKKGQVSAFRAICGTARKMKASAAGLLIILMTLLIDGNIMEELLISYQRLIDMFRKTLDTVCLSYSTVLMIIT